MSLFSDKRGGRKLTEVADLSSSHIIAIFDTNQVGRKTRGGGGEAIIVIVQYLSDLQDRGIKLKTVNEHLCVLASKPHGFNKNRTDGTTNSCEEVIDQ